MTWIPKVHRFNSVFPDIIPEPLYSFRHDDGRGLVQTFSLPLNRSVSLYMATFLKFIQVLLLRGKIHHIRASNLNGMKEADDIFVQYQEQAKTGQLKFRRWPMRAVSKEQLCCFIRTIDFHIR